VPVAASANPYTAAASTAAAEGAIEGQGPRERVGRNFRFNQKGKYVALGDQLRKDAKLEEIKQRIADSARKAGLDGQFETVEKSIKV
jgi:U4/U6 small nuclear ribonucleoprotein PRP3